MRAFAFTALRADDRAAAFAPLRFFTAVFVAGLDAFAFCLAIVCLPDLSRARRTGGARRQIIQSWTMRQLRGSRLDAPKHDQSRSLSEAVVVSGRRLVFVSPLN